MSSTRKVFFITGCSSGLGRAYVEHILDHNAKNGTKHAVVASARKPETLKFENTTEDTFLGLKLDVTDKSQIDNAFKQALEKFGQIDVVVNNAGYSYNGVFEALEDKLIRKMYDTMVFGLMDVTRSALAIMRKQSTGGCIQQLSSIGGQIGAPCATAYISAKWAVEGFTEALQGEMDPKWNIHLTAIEPGSFETDIWERNQMGAEHPDYPHMNAAVILKMMKGENSGSPPAAAKIMFDLATVQAAPPLRLLIGHDAQHGMEHKLKRDEAEVAKWKKVTTFEADVASVLGK